MLPISARTIMAPLATGAPPGRAGAADARLSEIAPTILRRNQPVAAIDAGRPVSGTIDRAVAIGALFDRVS